MHCQFPSHIPRPTADATPLIFHDSLFVGLRAVHHQRQVCHMHHYAPEKIYPSHCILHTCQGVQCTQQHELFDCPAVQPLWTVTRRLVTELGDTDPVPTTIRAYMRASNI